MTSRKPIGLSVPHRHNPKPKHCYECWNHASQHEGYWSDSRVHDKASGRFEVRQVFIVSNLGRQCKYDKATIDPNCKGCKHAQEYDQ